MAWRHENEQAVSKNKLKHQAKPQAKIMRKQRSALGSSEDAVLAASRMAAGGIGAKRSKRQRRCICDAQAKRQRRMATSNVSIERRSRSKRRRRRRYQ